MSSHRDLEIRHKRIKIRNIRKIKSNKSDIMYFDLEFVEFTINRIGLKNSGEKRSC